MKTYLELSKLFKTIPNWDTIGTGAYGVVKWLVIAVVGTIIGVTVRLIIGGLYGF